MASYVRWSPHSTIDSKQFVLLDTQSARIQLCRVESVGSANTPVQVVQHKVLCSRDRLPNFTAFDFSRNDRYIVGLGGGTGEATIVSLNPDKPQAESIIRSFPVKSQRRCNSLAFNSKNVIATALERVRNDSGLSLCDLGGNSPEPFRKLAPSEGVTSVKFFGQNPDLLLAGIQKQYVRLYDLRDNHTSNAQQCPSRIVHNLAIDPLDENYFISAGPEKEPIVAVWDRRHLRVGGSVTPSSETGPQGAVLEMRPALDTTNSCSILSLRFSGVKRGCFEVLSSSGELRTIELAQHAARSDLKQSSHNALGGSPWASTMYTRRTHTLAHPAWSSLHGRDEKLKIVSCDFMSWQGLSSDVSLLALNQNRQITRLKMHGTPRKLNITALDEIWLWKDRPKVLKVRERAETSAADLITIQEKANLGSARRTSDQSLQNSSARLRELSLESLAHKTPNHYESPFYTSSNDKHEDLMSMNFPQYTPSLEDALKLLPIQRRRCQEGYSLVPAKNQRIVDNDPWLVDMWGIIQRFEDLAKNDGMYHEGVDLAYLGVYAIWTQDFNHRNRIFGRDSFSSADYNEAVISILQRRGYPSFQGHKTKFPALRQLCLAVCGWAFSKEVLRQKCQILMDRGQYYKAIVVAVMRGFKDLAQDLLRTAIQTKRLQNIGLGAVIACESVNEEQRELCSWMAEETDDPYLKALLAYFVSGDWKVVADMPLLPLSDRIGCALKYVDDTRLTEFIKLQTSISAVAGHTEGLVLTGLTDRAVDLFRQYVAKFNDLQTAVLAMSFSCPVYVSDPRFDMWRETYLMQMQTWRAFNERTAYLDAHTKRSSARSGARFGNAPARPLTLRCIHCQGTLAPHTLKRATTNTSTVTQSTTGTLLTVSAPKMPFSASASAHSGLVCPHCGRAMPHCGICGLLLGAPDPRKVNGAAAELLAKEDALFRQALFCVTCTHVFHGNHARDWFARHKMCPVPDYGMWFGRRYINAIPHAQPYCNPTNFLENYPFRNPSTNITMSLSCWLQNPKFKCFCCLYKCNSEDISDHSEDCLDDDCPTKHPKTAKQCRYCKDYRCSRTLRNCICRNHTTCATEIRGVRIASKSSTGSSKPSRKSVFPPGQKGLCKCCRDRKC
ncbi:hypothetical protein BT63DRAFT_479765 [Microthyrium microscopicum]|uniref:Uncharacterized protein n=1 Tax=Microthyrium microscopicum TaxID=703497 RepID=A0A6A6UA84_9PEZI|nr:hypothetical protein BT63DRAFT_479765 [Microthyrium microscopicum]